MKYSIIMPFYGMYELTHSRMYEFFKNLPHEDVEVILIDDGTNDHEVDGAVAFWQKQVNGQKVRYRKHKENLGFGASMNDGASMADGEIIILYSNDVVCKGNFLPSLSPMLHDNGKLLIGGELITFPSGWNDIDNVFAPYCNGWFLSCTKSGWNLIGGFDPIYGKFDYEDIDLSMKALSLGFELRSIPSTYVRHIGGQTISRLPVERESQTRKNGILFRNKWSGKVDFLLDLCLESDHVYSIRGKNER